MHEQLSYIVEHVFQALQKLLVFLQILEIVPEWAVPQPELREKFIKKLVSCEMNGAHIKNCFKLLKVFQIKYAITCSPLKPWV